MKNKLSLLLSLVVIASVILTACGAPAATEPAATEPGATEPAATEPGTGATEPPVTVSEFKEAPMLADLVASGDLPPVEERLPVKEDIMVVTPVDGIGEYGGVWHETTWYQGMGNIEMTVYDPPIRWKSDYTGYEPGLVKEWEISEDGKTLTWHFRQGVKWSDGVD